ncbi:polyhydroxyalkanoate depolymerase [Collimonas humicola]|uniref:polyhydroxyalkanoate depolymerase n=1 Tax=Collimonas humicola TaxID=2825886 RepID=UPI001B8D7ECF|nr:polyhydroxyalkanoate depolymerase [Collimonas humicola]
MTKIYQAYQGYADLSDPMRILAGATAPMFGARWPGWPESLTLRKLAAACEVFACTQLTHQRPAFGINSAEEGGRTVSVQEEVADQTPFCTLLRFRKETKVPQPRILLVAPMSGHFATLLRGTVVTLLRDHDVYITDWHNARDVALCDGRFGFDEYVAHLIRFIEKIGPGTHLVAVCQPTVAALAAVSLMAAEHHPAQPASMTLMAGPIDTRINPTAVNELAKSKPIAWFEKNLVSTVPVRYAGSQRQVYPGFLQLTAFMNMNLERHLKAFQNLYNYLVEGEDEKANTIKTFYAEYFAMSDLAAEFYLETVQSVFQDHALPLGEMQALGRTIDPAAIRRTALFTVEGEKDDICAVGQTVAAQDMCSGIRPYMKLHHVQTGVGHYGVFNGRRWDNEIYPRLREFVHSHEP